MTASQNVASDADATQSMQTAQTMQFANIAADARVMQLLRTTQTIANKTQR
jgi:hypothetical protein